MEIPLPDKFVNRLNAREMATFRQWIGFEGGGGVVPYPSPEEAACRRRREGWKRRYAGKGAVEPALLVGEEQVKNLRANVRRNAAARRWLEKTLAAADQATSLPLDFWDTFIPDLGPWDSSGTFCPHCYRKKSPERIGWKWSWKDPDLLACPYCNITYPNPKYPENGVLELPRMGVRYTFHILKAEQESHDWRLGECAKKFVGQPIHESFTGSIRARKIEWALQQTEALGLAYAFTGKAACAKTVERILLRMTDVYPGYLLHSYFHDIVDADPGYAVENADALPTVFKRNACIGAYDGGYGRGQEQTTTRVTRVATGLWGCSRIAREQFATGNTFLTLFQSYDLVKRAIEPEVRRRIEQDFLLELYLDVRAYTPITNKSGAVRAARAMFGQVYNHKKELQAGLAGTRRILKSQFHPDGSPIETPNYGHATIREGVWMVPELLKDRDAFYGSGHYRTALEASAALATPQGSQPPLDDCGEGFKPNRRTVDIASARCGIAIPGPGGPPSDFAILNTRLEKRVRLPGPGKALNRFYDGRRLACAGYGSGKNRVQMYVLGEDGRRGHRHAGALNVQLYSGQWDVFPDLGYISNHPANAWIKATASHQTAGIDGENSVPSGPSRLLGFVGKGRSRFVDMVSPLVGGAVLRRALTLIRKDDGLPILVDLFDVEGGRVHDYNVRVNAPPGQCVIAGSSFRVRKQAIYQAFSAYPLLDFQTAGKTEAGWTATWGRGDQKVRATVLSPCTELITYRSPGWRNAQQIPADPGKYFDTVAMRNRKERSRFIVVYDVCGRTAAVKGAASEEADGAVWVRIDLGKRRTIQVRVPGTIMEGSEAEWKVI